MKVIPSKIIVFLYLVLITIQVKSETRECTSKFFNKIVEVNFITPYDEIDYRKEVAWIIKNCKNKIDFNLKTSKSGRTILIFVSQNNQIKQLNDLIASKVVDVNLSDNQGRTALMYASKYGHIEIVKKLIASGADINTKDLFNFSALDFASRQGRKDVAEDLVLRGAKYKKVKKSCSSKYLHNIGYRNNNRSIKWFVKKCKNVVFSYNKMTPLIFASKEGFTNIVKKLLAADVNVNAKETYGRTALMFAAEKGYNEIVEALINKDATTVSQKDQNGFTALIYAARGDNLETVKILSQRGSDIKLHINLQGIQHTPLTYAAKKGHKDIENFLRSKIY